MNSCNRANQPASGGLSVVDDSVAWVSGSRGYIAITRDGGKNWAWQQVKGFEKADFRDIEAFSDKSAVIMSSGTPALVLKTTDGGANWKVKYKNTDTTYFLDAMDFDKPKHGLILGDPIGNKFLLLETNDSGETWNPFKSQPTALKGEAAFAASGTCLRVIDGKILIASGGTNSRLLSWSDKKGWNYINFPITHGKPSQGSFSVAQGRKSGILIGGDYANDKKTDSIAVRYLSKPLKLLTPPAKQPAGFQSCVEFIMEDTFLSTGTPGSNITTDGGKTWSKIDDTSFNVCRKAKRGKLVILAGNSGKIGVLKM
ncbi:WD40/YVTN/BNR-like repeat-containing protein [Mucilaginibacter xinganensis]|uniref:Photosynthesis system II assembly factor Ycf48/Hcf136-like domain-containing protein n=1 Tax=Mucilaginibacter xinganensis TaxID=1234841 RepID=A0A223NTH9_9SPHI|nr:YCF48-related protein [Mucilaginibacter xinganensis]ASU33136.1 hypothetical protein MuYL_1238 [Mucilaginibacter xinganensis]